MEITGTIKVIEATKQVSDKFKSRQFVVTTNDTYPQHISLQCKQDKCAMLDNYKVGQEVTASCNILGREWQSPQGETKYFNTLNCWRIEKAESATPQGSPSGMTPPAMPSVPATDGMDEDDLPFQDSNKTKNRLFMQKCIK